MALTVQKCTIRSGIETFVSQVASGAVNTNVGLNKILYDGFDDKTVLTTATTPDVDTTAYLEATLSGGALTVDLTSLVCLDTTTVNLNGKKVRSIKFRAKSTSTGAFTIAKGASNGYTGFGSAFSVVLEAATTGGSWVQYYTAGTGTAVSGTVKTLDITGTGSQVLLIAIAAGD